MHYNIGSEMTTNYKVLEAFIEHKITSCSRVYINFHLFGNSPRKQHKYTIKMRPTFFTRILNAFNFNHVKITSKNNRGKNNKTHISKRLNAENMMMKCSPKGK